MRMPQGTEWLILLIIVLLLFGASRLPALARSVGKSMKIFRSEVKDLKDGDTPARTTSADTSAPVEHPAPRTGPDDGDRTP